MNRRNAISSVVTVFFLWAFNLVTWLKKRRQSSIGDRDVSFTIKVNDDGGKFARDQSERIRDLVSYSEQRFIQSIMDRLGKK